MSRPHGFTLIELLVVLGLILVLGALAAPQWAQIKREHDRHRAETSVRQAFALARSLARTGAVSVTVEATEDGLRVQAGVRSQHFPLPPALRPEARQRWIVTPDGHVQGPDPIRLGQRRSLPLMPAPAPALAEARP